MTALFVPFIGVVLVLALAVALAHGLNHLLKSTSSKEVIKPLYDYNAKKSFMTSAEQECFNALMQAAGNDYYIFPQVYLSTIVDHKITGQDWRAALSHIQRKSVDFVLCDKVYLSPKLVIELDDRSHEREDRIDRDYMIQGILHGAGIPLLRLVNNGSLNPAFLSEQIKAAVQ